MEDKPPPDPQFPLPKKAIVLGYVAAVKALSPEGDLTLYHVRSDEISTWEAIGMLTDAQLRAEDALRAAAADEDEMED